MGLSRRGSFKGFLRGILKGQGLLKGIYKGCMGRSRDLVGEVLLRLP